MGVEKTIKKMETKKKSPVGPKRVVWALRTLWVPYGCGRCHVCVAGGVRSLWVSKKQYKK